MALFNAAWFPRRLARYPFTYLASPYTHPDPAVREARFQAACSAAAGLMADGKRVFCPIAHSHPIEVASGRVETGRFWKRQDEPFLWSCTELAVLKLDGWESSLGILHEVDVATSCGIPILYLPA